MAHRASARNFTPLAAAPAQLAVSLGALDRAFQSGQRPVAHRAQTPVRQVDRSGVGGLEHRALVGSGEPAKAKNQISIVIEARDRGADEDRLSTGLSL